MSACGRGLKACRSWGLALGTFPFGMLTLDTKTRLEPLIGDMQPVILVGT